VKPIHLLWLWLAGLIIGTLASCATAPHDPTPGTELAARLEQAHAKPRCTPHYAVPASCVDDQGMVWSACAWNACGIEEPCRGEAQAKVAAGSCGEPYWPACKRKENQ
jgi:hypothetical protein